MYRLLHGFSLFISDDVEGSSNEEMSDDERLEDDISKNDFKSYYKSRFGSFRDAL